MEDQASPLPAPHWRPRLADAPPEFTPLHLVIEGGDAMIVVDRPEMVAGRHSEADICLPLPDVSRRHCRFAWADGRWQVADLGSLNGLWVNDRPVQQAALEQGDRVRIGGFTFVVYLHDAAGEPSLYRLFKTLPPPRRLAS
jgi:pSer/pThr/pTyr-binding forkhead associated (FHA) protein